MIIEYIFIIFFLTLIPFSSSSTLSSSSPSPPSCWEDSKHPGNEFNEPAQVEPVDIERFFYDRKLTTDSDSDAKIQQIRLALAADPRFLTVSWVSFHNLTGVVQVQKKNETYVAIQSSYRAGRLETWSGFIYHAKMGPFQFPDAHEEYRVGLCAVVGEKQQRKQLHLQQHRHQHQQHHQHQHQQHQNCEYSDWIDIRTPPINPRPATVALMADHGAWPGGGVFAPWTTAALRRSLSQYEMVMDVGDLAYAYGFQFIWDELGRQMAPITSRRPYHVACGNHESRYNFTAFRHRFFMPESPHSNPPFWYSLDYGLGHFTVVSTEHSLSSQSIQRQWLAADLARAHANRHQYPFIVVLFHKPIYCSNSYASCQGWAAALRRDLETLLASYADLVVTGHVHAAQATFPVFNCTSASPPSFQQPNAPIYLLIGNGGAIRGGHDAPFASPPPPWSAFQNSHNFGFVLLTFSNRTSATVDFRSVEDTSLFKFSFNRRLNKESLN